MHRVARFLAFALVAALALPALAAEGRIPLPFAGPPPYVIGAPGKYIVTRNLGTAVGPLFDVFASDVEIDLNGMEVSSSDMGNPVIRSALGTTGFAVRNGTIIGGNRSIEVNGAGRVVIEDVKSVASPGGADGLVLTGSTNFAIRRCQIQGHPGTAIRIDGSGGSAVTGTVESNVIDNTGTGIQVLNGSAVGLLHNRVRKIAPGTGIFLDSTAGSLVMENTLEDIQGDAIFIRSAAGTAIGNKLFDNVVHRCSSNGIHLAFGSNNTFVLNNVVTVATATGLLVDSSQNNIEGNTLNANGDKGLWLTGGSFNNVYRRNMGRGNAAGACFGFFTGDLCNDGGGSNTTPGDNYLPFLL